MVWNPCQSISSLFSRFCVVSIFITGGKVQECGIWPLPTSHVLRAQCSASWPIGPGAAPCSSGFVFRCRWSRRFFVPFWVLLPSPVFVSWSTAEAVWSPDQVAKWICLSVSYLWFYLFFNSWIKICTQDSSYAFIQTGSFRFLYFCLFCDKITIFLWGGGGEPHADADASACDMMREASVKIFCGKCDDIYYPRSSRHKSVLVVFECACRRRCRCRCGCQIRLEVRSGSKLSQAST